MTRVEDQITQGLLEETRALLNSGVAPDAPAMSAIGYPEMVAVLQDRMELGEAIERIKFHTHRYARHQMTWLRRMREVNWFDPDDEAWFNNVILLAEQFLGE